MSQLSLISETLLRVILFLVRGHDYVLVGLPSVPFLIFWILAFDIETAFEDIIGNVQTGGYKNEYEFQSDLYLTFSKAKDGHFRYYPDLLTAAIEFRRGDLSLVSVSLDGTSVPEIYTTCKFLGTNFMSDQDYKPWKRILTFSSRHSTLQQRQVFHSFSSQLSERERPGCRERGTVTSWSAPRP